MQPVLIRHSTSMPASFAVVVGVPPTILGRGEPLSVPSTAGLTAVKLSRFPTSSVLVSCPLNCGFRQLPMKWPSLPHWKQELGLGRETKLASSWFRVSCCWLTTSSCWSMRVIRTFCCFCISSTIILFPEMRSARTWWCLLWPPTLPHSTSLSSTVAFLATAVCLGVSYSSMYLGKWQRSGPFAQCLMSWRRVGSLRFSTNFSFNRVSLLITGALPRHSTWDSRTISAWAKSWTHGPLVF